MTSLTKKLFLSLFSVAAAVCLAVGIFALPVQKSSALSADIVTLNDIGDFDIEGTVLNGLSSTGAGKIGGKPYEVVIPESVTAISANAFAASTSNATALESVTVPAGVTSIGERAFAGQRGLLVINFNATACNDFAAGNTNPFYNAGLSVDGGITVNIGAVNKLPANMFNGGSTTGNTVNVGAVNFNGASIAAENFGAYAFAYNRNLKTVNFSNTSIEEIGSYAFAYTAIGEIAIPDEVKTIKNNAFANSSLSNLQFTNNSALAIIEENAFTSSRVGVVGIPASVTSIGANAFMNCAALTRVTFGGNSIKTISGSTFEGCTALETAALPEGVKTIGQRAFNGCSSLKTITVPASVTWIGGSAFGGCTAVTDIYYLAAAATTSASSPFQNGGAAKVHIGSAASKVTMLPAYLFNNTNISEVEFVNAEIGSVTNFNNSVFSSCAKLTTVNFNNQQVSVIGENVFSGCTSLYSLTLPTALQTIGVGAFNNCSSLYRLTVPASVTAIGEEAFKGCTKLIEVQTNLAVNAGSPSYGGLASNAKHVYSLSNTDTYFKNDEGLVYYDDDTYVYIVSYRGDGSGLTDGVLDLTEYVKSTNTVEVFDRAFYGNESIKGVKLEGVKVIGASAFAGTGLTSLNVPASVDTIGEGAFSGCTSLKDAKFAQGFSVTLLSQRIFSGCTSLEEVDLSATRTCSIGFEAFNGCISLTKVAFSKNPVSSSYKIEGSAFKGCTSLTVMDIPDYIKNIGANAFEGCTALKTIYLPSDASYGASVFAGTDALLISATSADYELDAGKLSAYVDRLTYRIELNLNYGRASHTEYRLFGRSYNYVADKDGVWAEAENGWPVQAGYKTSVWYTTRATTPNADLAVTADGLNEMLSNGTNTVITLYAIEVPKPTAGETGAVLTYADNVTEYSASEVLLGTHDNIKKALFDLSFTVPDYNRYFNVKAVRYSNATGSVMGDIKISDAGTYTLELGLKEGYGEWAENITLTFRIDPETVDILSVVAWGTGDSASGTFSPLKGENTPLYFYKGIPYDQEQENFAQDENSPKSVSQSYVTFTGRPITVVMNLNDWNYGNIVAGSYTGQTQTDAGEYSASVQVKLSSNYDIGLSGSNLYGITFRRIDLETVLITKTWYIVISNANELQNEDGARFGISGWEYSASATAANDIATPRLAHGEASELVTFKLWRTVEMSDENAVAITGANAVNLIGTVTDPAADNFNYYINSSMPADDYTVIFYIAHIYDTDGTTLLYAGTDDAGLRYDFTVSRGKPADLKLGNGTLGGNYDSYLSSHKTGGVNGAFTALSNGEIHFADESVMDIFNVNLKVHPEARGLWAGDDYANYYKNFEITYRIVATAPVYNDGNGTEYHLKSYYTATDNTSPVKTSEPGVYRIYYQISAPSYDPLVDFETTSAENRPYYELAVQITLNSSDVAITSGSVVYNGASRMDVVRNLLASDYYSINFIDRNSPNTPADLRQFNQGQYDDYIAAGKHYVFLQINSTYSGYIVWGNGINVRTVTNRGKYAAIEFTVSRALNETGNIGLYMKNWRWGDDISDIRPEWSTRYGNDYSSFRFELRPADLSDTRVYYYYGNGELPEGQQGFGAADAGDYILSAYAPIGTSWEQFSESIPFNILKARINWETTPYIAGWKYGDFDEDEFEAPVAGDYLPEAFAALDIQSYYCYASDYGKENINKFTLEEFARRNGGQVPAGNYMLVFELSESANYEEWSEPIAFSVIKAFNFWDSTPTVHDWVYGDYGNGNRNPVSAYSAHFGNNDNVVLEYRKVDPETHVPVNAWQTSVVALGLDAEGELPAGAYEFRATLSGNDNYDTLRFSMYFNVLKTQNGWKEDNLPGVISWREGHYNKTDNAFMGQARFGTVEFTVTDEKGNTYGLDKLNSLKVGSYYLTAHVAGTESYEELTNSVQFNVVEDSVGMTGLIAATVVFAVIATGLAAAAIILLVLRNKKIEAEFRRAVRAELRRRK